MTTKYPAPDILLHVISCGCRAGCGTTCGCRKIGWKFGSMCTFCLGQTYTSTPQVVDDNETTEELCGASAAEDGDVNEQESFDSEFVTEDNDYLLF